jgi:hypothetical protein
MRNGSRSTSTLAALVFLFVARPGRAADVLTQHNDNARTGANTAETVLTTRNVKPDAFGKLWTLFVDGQVVAQPLYVANLAVDTSGNPGAPVVKGTFNAVVIATMHNTVYLYDADKENRQPDGSTRPLWATWLGPPRPGDKDHIDMWSTNDPEWGILSTPVIDPQKATIWVVAWHNEGGSYRYKLHALDLHSGAHRGAPVILGGAPPNPQQPCQYPGGFNPCNQKQRSALLLAGGMLYIALGGDGMRGNVFAYDSATLQQRAFWLTTPKGKSGGIWQSGQGPAADADGHVYVVTGNGSFDAEKGNYGDSFVKLKLENGALAVKDYFTPCNQGFLDSIDLDFGAGGAVLIPGTSLTFAGGKEGIVYLLARDNLGKYHPGAGPGQCTNPNAVQAFQATDLHVHGPGTTYGHIHSSPVFWKGPDKSRIYLWGENDRLKAFVFAGGKFQTNDPVKGIFQPPEGMPGGMLAVSSNGARAGSGIVWGIVPLDGDANRNRGVQGVLIANDAQNVSRQLWTSEVGGARDRLGLFAKYVPPTVAGGKVFVATYGDREALRTYGGDARPAQLPARYYVAVYGLLPPHPQHARPIVNQDRDDVTVTRASATAALTLDSKTCDQVGAGNADCTAALSRKFGAPSLHTVLVPVGFGFAGCNLLTVTTASNQAGLAVGTGIGWYASDAAAGSQAMTSGRFVRSGELKQVGTGQFKNGAPALLHEFVGVANCTVGQGSLDKVFKPFVQFENSDDGNIYRNWDRAQNHRITRVAPQLDRSGQVLGP